jgi:hypothetical protein
MMAGVEKWHGPCFMDSMVKPAFPAGTARIAALTAIRASL